MSNIAESSNSLIEGFNQYFEIQRANSRDALDDTYRIRYDVYCKEFGYDLPSHDNLEEDEFDAFSSHCLLIHKQTRKNVGCIRVISLPENPVNMELPFITHCSDSLYKDKVDIGSINASETCEISRVAVVSEFRRRAGEQNSKDGLATNLTSVDEDALQNRRFPFIAPSLYLAAGAIFLAQKKKQIFVATEPKLIQNLSILGIQFQKISELTDYHGLRAVYYFTRESIQNDIKAMPATLREFFNFIERQVT